MFWRFAEHTHKLFFHSLRSNNINGASGKKFPGLFYGLLIVVGPGATCWSAVRNITRKIESGADAFLARFLGPVSVFGWVYIQDVCTLLYALTFDARSACW